MTTYQENFTCKMGELPMKYLGMHVFDSRIGNKHWSRVVEKTEMRCACWQGKLLGSIVGRITLVQAY